jgi:outer membrane protein assembly factor BamB
LPEIPSAGGSVDRERVFVPLQNDQTVALMRETGEIVWSRDIESQWPPVVHDGVLFLAASDELHALDAASGDSLWRVDLPASLTAPLTIAGDILVAPTGMGQVLGMRAADGRIAWTHSLGATPRFGGVGDAKGAIYFSMPDSRLRAIAAADGRMMWERTLSGVLSEPAVARERVFVGSTDNILYALRADTGALAWMFGTGGDVIGAAADDEMVYAASLDNLLRGLNRGNGNQRWKQAINTRPLLPPRAAAGVVWLSGLTSLMTFSAKTGAAASTFEAPSELQGLPLVDPVLQPFRVAVVLITRDGKALGLRPVGMMFREAPAAPLTQLPGRALQRERLP